MSRSDVNLSAWR